MLLNELWEKIEKWYWTNTGRIERAQKENGKHREGNKLYKRQKEVKVH